MIKADIIHPQLLGALALCGHKTQILIADGNYSFVTNSSKEATIVYLNLAPGMIASSVILDKVLKHINVEHASMMAWPQDFTNTIATEYQQLLPDGCPINYLNREAFYHAAKSQETLLVIASGEMRRFANLLLTVAPVSLAD
ncbi:TPA: RbsD/FucU domain-containing protein [Serratia fonticola]|jgi:L-fucose mutarotase|uniref:D-ribose pyranase n=1 Tax=Serratia fonticola TaxID=47917 RepID=A0A0F7H8A1_SERFO|nr:MULTISPECIES: RbsD/FucU domain-containing protein [Serratia]AKG68337.1 RbsD/FucU transporter [Serratia fonticola]AYM92008.1 RbsD/FucU transporter [Serratia sp. 3ACOL1]CAI0847432.1 D-ribose pyranase [Serratia fonticola]CAI0854627.1 D-ribose pyranase [Serratia fonticola]CAI0861905.1 D-ribose pyranase [Serratia fonticola]